MRLAVLLTLADLMLRVDVIGDKTTACPHTGADESTFSASQETADDRTSCGRTTHDLRLGVVPRVMVVLLTLGSMVGLLPEPLHWQKRHCDEKSETGSLKMFHSRSPRWSPCSPDVFCATLLIILRCERHLRQMYAVALSLVTTCQHDWVVIGSGVMKHFASVSFSFPYRYWRPVAAKAV